jgi:plastocyanin
MRRLVLAAALAASLAIAASAQGATYWVQVNGISFYTYNAMATLTASPTGDPTVDPGDTILWEWGNSGCHDVVSGNVNTGTPDGVFNTNAILCNGATFSFKTGASSASYTYYCTPHRASGMKGTIKATGTTNEPPAAVLTTTPAQPKPGDTITLDASASSDPEANLLAKYRWDLDGNGTFETSTTVPTTTVSFQAGNHIVALRVIDGKSALGEAQQTLTVQYPKPIPTTGSSSNVTRTGATLAGTVDPNGTATSYVFEYGTTTAYGSSTPGVDVGQGPGAVDAAATLDALTAGTLYHYRLVATNAGGTAVGGDRTFLTSSPPPVVAPPPAPAPPADTTAPVVTVAKVATQSAAGGVLTITVTPQEAGELTLKGRIAIPKRKAINLPARVVTGVAGTPAKLTLKLSKKTRALIRRALAQHKKVRATLTLTARDAAGNLTTKTIVVRLR